MQRFLKGLPGLIAVVILAFVAVFLAKHIDLGLTLTAILLGFIVGNILPLSQQLKSGITWVESYGLSIAVALLGVQLNLSLLMQIQAITLAVIALTIVATFLLTLLLVKTFRMNVAESCLLASGQAICGSAAVMAATKTLKLTNKAQAGLIIAVINFLGFLGVFIIPELGRYFFPDNVIANGFLMGNSLQSMGHVVAAGFGVSEEVGQGAVLIKMCRILFLIPTLLVLVFWVSHSTGVTTNNNQHDKAGMSKMNWLKLIPIFIWFFLALILFNNLGWINNDISEVLTRIGDALFVLAMVAIGLSIRLQDIWHQCSKLLLVAALVFTFQIAFTLVFLNWI